jgi:hypothetical protein
MRTVTRAPLIPNRPYMTQCHHDIAELKQSIFHYNWSICPDLHGYVCCQIILKHMTSIYTTARWPSFTSTTIQPRWYGKDEWTSYAIVQHFPSYVRAAAIGAAYSRSGTAVPADPADASEDGICAAKNCVAWENWTQDLSSDTMLEDPPLSVQSYNSGDMKGTREPLML